MIYILALLGLSFGSFVNAFVWRYHENSKVSSSKKKFKEEDLSIINGRSMCPNCRHTLSSIDLFPVFSWLLLKGKCRYCHKPISISYPLVEIITAIIFVISYLTWGKLANFYEISLLVIWLGILIGLISLSLYDIKWYILPSRIIYFLLPFVILFVILNSLENKSLNPIIGSIYGSLILGGLFYLIFQVSKGKWIGGGDIRLGALLGILVGGPSSAILLLLIASFSGTLISLPLIAINKLNKKSVIPFGPFLIFGAIIVVLFGTQIINWYKNKILYVN